MEITQSDRDSLRAAQRRISDKVIGNIVEYEPQSLKNFKNSRKENNQVESTIEEFKIEYKSKYLNMPNGNGIIESKIDEELPISPSDVQANSWLHMDHVELDKIEWMSSKQDDIGSTKFDKHGKVQSSTIVGSKASECNGTEDISHDIEQLINLLDSAYQPQVTYALLVVSKIADLATSGYYDGVFNENIHEILIRKCLLRARLQLDSPNETICLHALVCIKALICNTYFDEINMDRIFPILAKRIDSNVWLQTNPANQQEFDIEMKDINCVELDAVLALIERTNIIERLVYLINNKATGKHAKTYSENILDILIRFARHSTNVCLKLNDENLLTTVIKTFLPTKITSETRHILPSSVKALKFLRIIAQAIVELESNKSKRRVIDCKIPSSIADALQVYFFIDSAIQPTVDEDHIDNHDNSNSSQDEITMLSLNIETLRIIQILQQIKKFFTPILNLIVLGQSRIFVGIKQLCGLRSVAEIEPRISTSWTMAAHLISLVGFYYETFGGDLVKFKNVAFVEAYWNQHIKVAFFQWLTDIIMENYIPHPDVSIAIFSTFQYSDPLLDEKDSRILREILIDTNEKIVTRNKFFFKKLIEEADARSQMKNFLVENGQRRDPKCLPSYGTVNFNITERQEFKLNQLYQSKSPFLLLEVYILELQEARDTDKMRLHLNWHVFTRYINVVTAYHSTDMSYERSVQQSLFAQFEVNMVARSLLLLFKYFFEFVDVGHEVAIFETTCILDEPEGLKDIRDESYSTLCQYVVAIVGLLNGNETRDITKAGLKQQLFEKILLNHVLQRRISNEHLQTSKRRDREKGQGSMRYIYSKEQALTRALNHNLKEEHSLILTPLYTSLEQSDRFWILEPLKRFYLGNVVDDDEKIKRKENHDDRWFNANIPFHCYSGMLKNSTDGTILAKVLDFHLAMMIYSPGYERFVVKPTVEDHLCLIGSLFLNNDIFLDHDLNVAIHQNLEMILCHYLKDDNHELVTPFQDATVLIKPLNMILADFFNKLVDQFEAVSYGDLGFSNFLLLFIAPKSDKIFRKQLFQEKVETCLSQLTIDEDDLWVPKELFYCQKESDPEIKSSIKRAGQFIKPTAFLNRYRNFHCN